MAAINYQAQEFRKTFDEIDVLKNLEGVTIKSVFDEIIDIQIIIAGNSSSIEQQYGIFSEKYKKLTIQAI